MTAERTTYCLSCAAPVAVIGDAETVCADCRTPEPELDYSGHDYRPIARGGVRPCPRCATTTDDHGAYLPAVIPPRVTIDYLPPTDPGAAELREYRGRDYPEPDGAPCIAGDHWPNDAGTACAYCGLPAVQSVGPDPVALYAFTYHSADAIAERDAAQQARAGGRAILRYYAVTTRPYRPWTIAVVPSHDHALDPLDAEYARTYRARRDAGSNYTRPHWPVMRAAEADR